MDWPEGVLFYSDPFSPYFEEYYFDLNALFPPVPYTVPVWKFFPWADYVRFEPEGFPVGSGLGKLSGSLTADQVPVQRMVYLYADLPGRPGNLQKGQQRYGQMMTDENGLWEFTNLPMDRTYTVMSLDTNGDFDPAIIAGRVPVPM